jgi:GntR family transcriptional regulator
MELLEKKAKIHVTSGEQLLTAVTAEPSLASLLNIRVGAPLLRAERTLYDSELRPVQFVVAHYRGDRYSVLVNLERSGFQPEDIKNWKINPEGSRVHVSRG